MPTCTSRGPLPPGLAEASGEGGAVDAVDRWSRRSTRSRARWISGEASRRSRATRRPTLRPVLRALAARTPSSREPGRCSSAKDRRCLASPRLVIELAPEQPIALARRRAYSRSYPSAIVATSPATAAGAVCTRRHERSTSGSCRGPTILRPVEALPARESRTLPTGSVSAVRSMSLRLRARDRTPDTFTLSW